MFAAAVTPSRFEPAEAYVQALANSNVDVTHVPYDRFASLGALAEAADAALIVLVIEADEDGHIDPETNFARYSLDSDIPVMVLRYRADREESFVLSSRIVVPLDDSATAAQALPLATRLARITRLLVRFVMVIDPSRFSPVAYAYDPEASGVIDDLRQTAHWALRQAEDQLRSEGVEVESDFLFGPVNACLRELLEETDLLVMTTQGSGRSIRRRFGSVARRVLCRCRSRP